jgi:hypothetical protein
MRNFSFIISVVLFVTLSGCNGCSGSKSREKPDVSKIDVQVQLLRFDKDLFEYSGNDYAAFSESMQSKYGAFYPFYIDQFIIGPRPAGDTADIAKEALEKFISDNYIRRLQDSINSDFSNTKDLEEELTQSFKYFKYYFPDITVPKVVSINSGFSLGAFTYDRDFLGIGLDLYLGVDNPDYDSAGIYQYLKHKMRREFIARNSMEVTYDLYFGEEEASREKNLAEAMVEKGKKMYLLSYVLPDAPDSLLTGFTQTQTTWCEKNEYDIWKYLNDKDLLYKNDYQNQKRYLDEGPTTQGMPAEAPGAIGNWIGLQIVRKFMKETGGKISLKDLITTYDSKTIWEKAKYRPTKPVM